MFKLDNAFLTNLGLGSLPVDEKNKLLQAIYERLEMNVGMRLAEKMSDQQLDEFEGFIDKNDEAGALKWLETNFPNYKQVVAEELEKLKQEVGQSAPQILQAAQSQGAGQPQQPPQVPPASQQFAQTPGQQQDTSYTAAPQQPMPQSPDMGQHSMSSAPPQAPGSYPPPQQPTPYSQPQVSQPYQQPGSQPANPNPQPFGQASYGTGNNQQWPPQPSQNQNQPGPAQNDDNTQPPAGYPPQQ